MNVFIKFGAPVFVLCAGAVTAVSVGGAAAQDAPNALPGKIGVVNRKLVFDNFEQRKADWDALEAEKNRLQAEIDTLREAVNEGKRKLREDTTLTEAQRQALMDKVAADERTYEDRWRRAQGEIDDKSDDFFDKTLSAIDVGVRDVGAAENYRIILESDPKAGSPVLYFSPSIDLTDKVTSHLNKK